ncbi:MAG: GCN5 family N-acetyltransferase [Phycisphaerae bacterium]|nr:MAG: GCN5 family N-acetyltransferase [Phycisphaerae bacterium]
MPMLQVRAATPLDVPFIVALVRELAEYERAPQEAKADDAMMRTALFGEPRAAEALIGEVDGVPQGIAVFFHNFSTWTGRRGMYLEDLFVRPSARGVGLGAALLRAVAGIAVERGCPRMDWLVIDWNEPAIGFYKSLGAVALDGWTVFRLSGESLTRVAAETATPDADR